MSITEHKADFQKQICYGLDVDDPELVINVIGDLPKSCLAKKRLRNTIISLLRMTGDDGNTWIRKGDKTE